MKVFVFLYFFKLGRQLDHYQCWERNKLGNCNPTRCAPRKVYKKHLLMFSLHKSLDLGMNFFLFSKKKLPNVKSEYIFAALKLALFSNFKP